MYEPRNNGEIVVTRALLSFNTREGRFRKGEKLRTTWARAKQLIADRLVELMQPEEVAEIVKPMRDYSIATEADAVEIEPYETQAEVQPPRDRRRGRRFRDPGVEETK